MTENIKIQSDISDVLLKLKTIIRDKTRFEADDVNQVSASEIMQSFVVSVEHRLAVIQDSELITGLSLSKDTSERQSSKKPYQDSVVAGEDLLEIASIQIQSTVINPETKYNFVRGGVFLKHPKKYYKLDNCIHCSGDGKRSCTTCSSSGVVTCTKCYGARRIACDAYGCAYGKQNCSACSGLGNRQIQVPKQVWSYATNSMATEYVWVTEQCNVCNYGKVNCSQCAGSSQINCSLCRATGNLTCNSCSGQGYISCISCEGSGRTGEAHWADVHISSEYKLTLSENPYDESIEILSKEGVHGVVPLVAGFAFERLLVSGHLNSQVTAHYKGYFTVYRLEASCNGKDYSIVAYGKDFKWLTLANLIEDLVVNDIKKLQKVLLESISQNIFNNETDSLLTATKNVIASEVNTDLIDADFSSKTEQGSDMFSTEFASNVKSNIKGAIKLIFIRFARKFWWKLSLAIPLIYFVSWFWGEKYLGIFTSFGTIVTGWLLFRYQTSKKLASSTIEKRHAKWMLDAAKRTGSDRIANAIVVLPSLAILIGLVATLPPHSFLKNQAFDIDSSIHVIPESPSTPQVLESKNLTEETSLEADKHEPDIAATVPGQRKSSNQQGDKKRKNSVRLQESISKENPNHPAAEDDKSIHKEIGIFPSEQIPTTHKTEPTNPSLEPNNTNEHTSELSKAVEKYTGLKVRPMTQEEVDNRKKNCPIPGQC